MDVFGLRERVVDAYSHYVKSFLAINVDPTHLQVENASRRGAERRLDLALTLAEARGALDERPNSGGSYWSPRAVQVFCWDVEPTLRL